MRTLCQLAFDELTSYEAVRVSSSNRRCCLASSSALSQRKLVTRPPMDTAVDQFFSFVSSERTSHVKRLCFAALMCILILALLYRTEWLILRPGLLILFAGQAGVGIALFVRNQQLSKRLQRRQIGGRQEDAITAWFEGEESFIRRLGLSETTCQMTGFAVLGYEFWLGSRSLFVALAIGIIYPAAMYFGITRKGSSKSVRRLTAKKQQIASMFSVRK